MCSRATYFRPDAAKARIGPASRQSTTTRSVGNRPASARASSPMALSENRAIIRVGGLASADEKAAAVGYAENANPAPVSADRWVS
jgi:hypothetical protein